MKKIVASVGFVALGAASVQAQYTPELTPQELVKPWSLSASLRGFYDDNYLTQPSTYYAIPPGVPTAGSPGVLAHPLSSYGIEVTPSATFNHKTEDTLIALSYQYDEKYYFYKDYNEQAHQASVRFEHAFSDKYHLTVSDTFVSAQDPTLIDTSIVSTPLLATGNNIHNTGTIGFNADMSKDFTLHLGYQNNMYSYRQVGGDETGINPNTGLASAQPYSYASRSAALDRIEQLATIDLRWKMVPDTTALVGYQYGHTDYTSPEAILYGAPLSYTPYVAPTPLAWANIRNNDQHYGYFGADHNFTAQFSGSIRAGAEYLDYTKFHTGRVSPYVDASLTDEYLPRSTAQVGVRHTHNSTDVVGITTPVLDEDTTAAYVSVNHTITDRLIVNAMGQAQFSTFNGGGPGYDGQSEDFFVAGIGATYEFNKFVSAEAGYNYSKLDSYTSLEPFTTGTGGLGYYSTTRSYTRNFVYLGLRATY